MATLSRHAAERMRERGIGLREVNKVLKHGQRSQTVGGLYAQAVRVKLNRIVAIVDPGLGRDYVVTVYLIGK